MSFEKAMNKMKFDIRLLEYNLSQGFITKEDYNKFLAQLEDSAHLVAPATEEVESEDGNGATGESH
jgi:hypothetical protein